MKFPKRMWINQPSTQQKFHDLHGVHVLAMEDHCEIQSTARVFFLEGPVTSQQMGWECLSDGWPSGRGNPNLRTKDFKYRYHMNLDEFK